MEQKPLRPEQIFSDEAAHTITRIEELAYELKIEEVMTHGARTVTPNTPIQELAQLFQTAHISGAPVLAGGELVGIVSVADLMRAMRQGDLEATVGQYMSKQVTTVRAYDPVIEALKAFDRTNKGRFPVVDENNQFVGIITKGDITRGVLKTLQANYQAEELRRYRASHLFDDIISDRTSLILRYRIKPGDFIHGGQASSHIKRALLRLGADSQVARRCGIAAYEAEMNLIIHTTSGGIIWVEIEPPLIFIQAMDNGPGISDIKQAMQPGYSTASDEAREMGFGAGMGLANIQRCADNMWIESTPGKGTTLEMRIYLKPEDQLKDHFQKGAPTQ